MSATCIELDNLRIYKRIQIYSVSFVGKLLQLMDFAVQLSQFYMLSIATKNFKDASKPANFLKPFISKMPS